MSRAEFAASSRETWVDAAKGVAIILVVTFHAVIFLGDIGLAGQWSKLSAPLDTFRMPLFFFTAGLFARRALSSSFPDLFRTRVMRLLWLYALWTLIWSIAFQFIPLHRETATEGVTPLVLWVQSFVWPNESTWFVYALAWYFVLAWAMRKVPPLAQLILAGIVAALVGSYLIEWSNGALEKAAKYFFFFLLAVHIGKWVRERVDAFTVGRLWLFFSVSGVIYLLALAIVLKLGVIALPGLRVALGIVGIAFGVALAVVISQLSWFTWVTALGRQTLPIYFVHFYVVLSAVALLAPFASQVGVVSVLGVPALVALAIGVSLTVHALTRRVPGLWNLPPWILERTSTPKMGEPRDLSQPRKFDRN